VGATKYYGGWNRAVRKLEKHPMGFELDESDYDASLFQRALWHQADTRFRYLRPEFQTLENMWRMHNLYLDVIHSIMVTPLGDVIVKDTGNPSGQGNTIVDNTMILYHLLAYAYIVQWKKEHSADGPRYAELLSLLDKNKCDNDDSIDEVDIEREMEIIVARDCTYGNFSDLIEMLLNGDDNTFSVSERIIKWYNARNIANIWSGIGVTTKTPCWEPRPIHQLSFLSQSTRYDERLQVYLPVPEHERIMDSLLHANEHPTGDVRWTLLRAYALRIESWGCLKTREALWDFINYVWRMYGDKLNGVVSVPKTGESMTYLAIANIMMSDKELSKLYCGLESDPSVRGLNRSDLEQIFLHAL